MNKRVYVKLINNMGTKVECQEFIFDNVKVINYPHNYLVLEDLEGHLCFKCSLEDIDRFVAYEC